jgi:hypothetical protein
MEASGVTVSEFEFTSTITVPVFTHPAELVPETVNTVVAAGLSTTEVVVALLPVQVYVSAPDAERVTDSPTQRNVLLCATVITGNGFIFTVTTTVEMHPSVLVPDTA